MGKGKLQNNLKLFSLIENVKIFLIQRNFTANPVPHLEVFWHHLNGMGTQKITRNVFQTFFSCMFDVKATWYSLQILQKQQSFQETLPKRH